MEYSGSAYENESDERLVQLVLQGEVGAFEPLVHRYQREVRRVIGALLYQPQDAEDLVQQVFLNAFSGLSSFQTGRDFGTWIRSIARNAVREQLRKQSRYDRRLQTYYEMLESRWAEDSTLDDDRSREEALRRCLDQLAGKAAEAVRWRYLENRGVNDIAAAWQMTANAVSKLLGRTRVALRDCVEKSLGKS